MTTQTTQRVEDGAVTTTAATGIADGDGTTRRFHLKPPSQFNNNNNNNNGMAEALLHTLRISGVQFLRYAALDVGNSIRTKATPIDRIDCTQSSSTSSKSHALNRGVSIAKVCMAGLPSYADVMLPDTNLDSRDVLTVKPDWGTLRILPYAPKSAMVMGTLHDRTLLRGKRGAGGGDLSEFCTRGLLQRLLTSAREQLGLGFYIGAEIEFTLQQRRTTTRDDDQDHDHDDYEPVDQSLFAHPTILNQHETFLSDLNSQLRRQDIPVVEQMHAESSSGQMEIVLQYRDDAVRIADDVLYTRETIVACAHAHNLRAVFRPKPIANGAGNGMHVHLSLYDCRCSVKRRRNLFSPPAHLSNDNDDGTKIISDIGGSFMEGILRHLPALTALIMASGESYARVGPGCWTGFDVRWGVEEKEVPLRVCLDDADDDDDDDDDDDNDGGSSSGDGGGCGDRRRMVASNVELKLLDHTANMYLALAGILRAGIDGICEGMKLRRPGMMTTTMADGDGDGDCGVSGGEGLPKSLDESLDRLQDDGVLIDMLGEGLSTSYIAVKRAEFQHYSERKSN